VLDVDVCILLWFGDFFGFKQSGGVYDEIGYVLLAA
jgi:hypothetical protein